MTRVERSALVLHTAEEMFNLVNDVAAYPQFLPWCAGADLISQREDELVATLHLAKAGLKYSFTTRNRLDRPREMKMELVEGPFSAFAGVWTFTPLSDEACKVSLDLSFDFAGKLTGLAMSTIFSQVASTLVDAFVTRADQVYG